MATNLPYKTTLDTSEFENGMKKMAGMASGLSGIVGGVAGGMGLSGVVSSISSFTMDFGKMGLDQLKKYQYFSSNMKVMMHGDIAGVKLLNDSLITLAKETPFSLEDVQTGTKNLMAYGFQADEIVDNLKMIGNVSSGVSAPLNDIIYLYGTLRASGRVTLMDIRQFAGRGIPIYEALQKTLHKTTAEILNMVSKGTLGFKDIEAAFKSMTGPAGLFFNNMEAAALTTGGQIDRLSDSWHNLGLVLAKDNEGVINIIVNKVADIVSSATDYYTNKEAVKEAGITDDDYNKFEKLGRIARNSLNFVTSGMTMFVDTAKEKTEHYSQTLHESLGVKATDDQYELQRKMNMLKQNEHILQGIKTYDEWGYAKGGGVMFESDKQRRLKLIKKEEKENTDKQISLLKKKDKTDEKNTKDGKELGLPTEYSGKRPQTINININELIGIKELNSSANTKEDYEKGKEMFLNILLDAVADVNKIIVKQ